MVRLVAYRIESNMLQPFQLAEFALRQQTHIRYIGNVTESEPQDRHLVVHASYRNDLNPLSRRRRKSAMKVNVICDTGRRGIPIVSRDMVPVRIYITVADIMHPDQFPVIISRLHEKRPLIYQMHVPFRSARIFLLSENIVVTLSERVQYRLFAIYFGSPAVDVVQ